MAYDLLIKNGRVIDGSGRPAYTGDVAVAGGKIVEVGRLGGAARQTIEADGRLTGCGVVVATTPVSSVGVAVSGSHAYISQGSDNVVLHCEVALDGSLGACRDSGADGLGSPFGITLR